MKKAKAILFDFNGTMVFDDKEHKQAWDHFSMKYRGKPVASEEMEQAHGRPNKQIIQLILGDMSESESEKLSSEKEAMYREVCRSEGKDYHLVFGLEELLEEAKQQGILMTIASASIKPNIDFFVEHFRLDRFFDPAKIIYDDGTHADKTTMYQKAAQAIGVKLEDCLIFEDSLSGIQSAIKCNPAKLIAVSGSNKSLNYQSFPQVKQVIVDYRKHSLEELLSL